MIALAHAQNAENHSNKNGQKWSHKSDYNKKHWFCKLKQSGNCQNYRGHESRENLQKHIYALCLSDLELAHPEKGCHLKHKSQKVMH